MRTSCISKLSVVVGGILFFATFTLAASPARGSCRIKNISLKKEGNFTEVSLYADKHFEFSHFTEEAKGGKPYRVVIDCHDAVFDLPQNNYKSGLPPSSITAIRTSQFQVDPVRIVRVVLDLKGPVVYKVTKPETENEASIAIMTAQDPDFSMWVAVLEEQKSDKSKTSPSGTEGQIGLKASEKKKAETVQEERVYRRAVCYADTGEVLASAEEKGTLLSQRESEEKVARSEESSKKKDELVQRRESLRKADTPAGRDETILSAEAKSKVEEKKTEEKITRFVEGQPTLPSSKQVPSAAHQVKAESIDKTKKEDYTVSTESASQPASKTEAQKKKTTSITLAGSEQNLSKKPSSGEQKTPSSVTWGPLPKEQSSPAEGAETRKTEMKKDATGNVASSIEKGIGAILGPEPAVARETRPMADSSMLIQELQEAELGLTPQRKMVHYNPETKRDIFMPLTKKEEMNFGEMPQPLFENLRLVGILKDEEGNRALLEDEMGFGYILMSGDEIKNGYVITVEENRAVFHVEEYGGYQIMALELNREY